LDECPSVVWMRTLMSIAHSVGALGYSQEYLRHLPLFRDFVLALVRRWHKNGWKLWPRIAGPRWAKVRCIFCSICTPKVSDSFPVFTNPGIEMDMITVVHTVLSKGAPSDVRKGMRYGRNLDFTRVLHQHGNRFSWNMEPEMTSEILIWSLSYITNVEVGHRRPVNNANRLLELIAQFPKINPSSTDANSEVDIPQLLSRIQSRYKVLCSSLGVRPSLRATRSDQPTESQEVPNDRRKESIWPVLSQLDPSVTNQDLSY